MPEFYISAAGRPLPGVSDLRRSVVPRRPTFQGIRSLRGGPRLHPSSMQKALLTWRNVRLDPSRPFANVRGDPSGPFDNAIWSLKAILHQNEMFAGIAADLSTGTFPCCIQALRIAVIPLKSSVVPPTVFPDAFALAVTCSDE